MKKNASFILFILLTSGCSPVPQDFKVAQSLFENFDTLLDPMAYAATHSYRQDESGRWVTPQGELVTMDIPYRNHFFTFGTRYAEQQPEGTAGVWSHYVLRYQEGVITLRVYALEQLKFGGQQYSLAYYVVRFDTAGNFVSAVLYDAQGGVIHEENINFLIS